MYNWKNKTVLILAPHTDDGELGCAGTISKILEEGANVYYAVFSICEESVPDNYPKNILEIEVKKASKHLGIKQKNLILKGFPVRKFNSYRQEILEELVVLRNTIKPQIIFMPNSHALHQDHKTIYEEGIRAFKHHTCFGYDLPWDTINFSSDAFFKLEDTHIQKKWESLEHYESQMWRTYCDRDFIFGLARVRGAQIGVQYAEVFESIRSVY
jgi:LmbE family N-acetylglucosaminyl deacetylase